MQILKIELNYNNFPVGPGKKKLNSKDHVKIKELKSRIENKILLSLMNTMPQRRAVYLKTT